MDIPKCPVCGKPIATHRSPEVMKCIGELRRQDTLVERLRIHSAIAKVATARVLP